MKNPAPGPKKPSGELRTFWGVHDANLKAELPPSQVHLSHNLYRGMPGWFNAFFDYFQRRIIRSWARACRIEPGMVSLDLGCGTGRWIGFMLGRKQEATGMDPGFNALRFAQAHWGPAHFVLGKLPDLCFAEETFHWAVSVTVLQHLPYADQVRGLREIHRLLKPGGYLMLCESIDLNDRSDYLFANSIPRWRTEFLQAGFEILDHRGCEFLPFIKGFHWVRDRWLSKSSSPPSERLRVSDVVAYLEDRPGLSFLLRILLGISYPGEFLAGWFFPMRWARLGCFLLRKGSCV